MKRICYFILFLFVLSSCHKNHENVKIGISAQYPPFAYMDNDRIVGFEVDLMNEIFKKFDVKIEYYDVQFPSIMPSLLAKKIDIGAGCITITEDRKKNFDFSEPYYFDGISAIFKNNQIFSDIKDIKNLQDRKIGCMIDSTQEIWSQENLKNNKIIALDSNAQLIEALKNDYIDVAIIDEEQSKIFLKLHEELNSILLEKAKDGYGFIFNRDSKIKEKIDLELIAMKKNGQLDMLIEKWFGYNNDVK